MRTRDSLRPIRAIRLALVVGAAAGMMRADALLADAWNQFRGPGGSGRGTASNLPIEFDDQQNVVWKTAIHGKGWSSPVVSGDQIWLTTAPEDGTRLYAVCVDLATGEILHDLLVFEVASPAFCHPTNSYASSTPFIEEGRVYVHFGSYGTACIDTSTGKKLWERRDFQCDHYRGPAASPIVHGDALYVSFDGVDQQYLVALDKSTGETIWRQPRDIDYGTDVADLKKAYSTPLVVRVREQLQLISPAAVESIAYDPADGSPLWRIRHGGMNAAAPPLYEHGLVYLAAGHGKNLLSAVRPQGRGDITGSSTVWKTGLRVPKRSCPIIVGERLYMVSDEGVASCLDARTGKQIWTKRLGEEHWASPIYADGLIYACSKKGTVTVFEAADEFVLRAENIFPAGFNATGAIVDNSLLLRSFTHLYRIGN